VHKTKSCLFFWIGSTKLIPKKKFIKIDFIEQNSTILTSEFLKNNTFSNTKSKAINSFFVGLFIQIS
jgi:hypothetical protein